MGSAPSSNVADASSAFSEKQGFLRATCGLDYLLVNMALFKLLIKYSDIGSPWSSLLSGWKNRDISLFRHLC